MNYPIESLAIVAPVIFVILVVAFPLIGVLAGWKRAAYWGGGNFIFYILGLIIWVLAGNAIAAALKPMITNLLSSLVQGLTVTDQLIASVISPVWFILFMAVSELILLINYYAWYKKVVGLKKIQVKTKNGMVKQYAKVNKKADTVGYKVGNKLGGAALLGILTLPTTMAFTQVIYNGTTSASTRAKNGFSSGLYNGLLNISTGPFSWLAYSPQTCYDFDALFSALALINVTVPGGGTLLNYIETTVPSEIQTIMENISSETKEQAGEAVEDLVLTWNTLVEDYPNEISGLFSSPNAIDLVKQMMPEQTFEIVDEDPITTMQDLVAEYEATGEIGGIKIGDLNQITITEEGFNSFTDFFYDLIEIKATDVNPDDVKNCMKDIISIIFLYPGMPDDFFTPDPTI